MGAENGRGVFRPAQLGPIFWLDFFVYARQLAWVRQSLLPISEPRKGIFKYTEIVFQPADILVRLVIRIVGSLRLFHLVDWWKHGESLLRRPEAFLAHLGRARHAFLGFLVKTRNLLALLEELHDIFRLVPQALVEPANKDGVLATKLLENRAVQDLLAALGIGSPEALGIAFAGRDET